MNGLFSSKSNYITSLFTRESGYTEIQTREDMPRKESLKILNRFTPQGASPKISMRIGSFGVFIGIGYYCMRNKNEATLSAILNKFNQDTQYQFINLPTHNSDIEDYVSDKLYYYTDNGYSTSILQKFDEKSLSILIYSILAGDNIIVIHPDHEARLQFFSEIFKIFPVLLLRYNRLTTNCTELDGNENIIGVATLPKKYRSHDKLHLPLDTIFVDLENHVTTGGGSKTNTFTFDIAKNILVAKNPRSAIINYLDNAINMEKNYKSKMLNFHLVQNIRVKLGIEQELQSEWLMNF